MNKFTLMQRIRNKIRVVKNTQIYLAENAKIVNCRISVKGEKNSLTISDGTRLYGVVIEIIGSNCKIAIGKQCMIGDNSYLSAKENNISLIVEDNCGFSRNVKIMTSDGHPIFQEKKRINKAQNILIKKNVWIADNVTILKGVTIGEGSVIGINATVTKDIQGQSIAVGNPAKVVKKNIYWKDKF